MVRYNGRRNYSRRRLGGGGGYGGGVMAPFGRPLYPVPFKRKYGSITSAPLRGGPRKKLKTGRSYTQTKTKTKQRFGTVGKIGENSSVSSTRFGNPMSTFIKTMYRKAQGRKTATALASGSTLGSAGLQSILEFSILNRSQLDGIKTEALAQIVGGGAANNNARLVIGYSKHRLVFRNQANCVAKCSVYDCVWKKSPLSSTFDTVSEVWRKGFTDMGLFNHDQAVGNTPFQSPEFRRHVHVQKVTSVMMEPGQQHVHTVYRKINRVVDTANWENGSTLVSVEDLTSMILIVWHGALGHENLTPGNVSYMPVRMDWAQHVEYNYGFLPFAQPSFSATGVLPTITDFDHMGENADVDCDIVNA